MKMERLSNTFHSVFLALALATSSVAAQVVTDGSVGSRVTRGGGIVTVEDSLGIRSGGNLFHSFESFSTADGNTTIFGVPDGVERVIGRVTGTEASFLNGVISFVDGSTLSRAAAADFWFFNPNGVMVGENAEFHTSAALYFSGGDSIIFFDGTTFSADVSQPLTITSAAPEAFGFLTRDPGPVILRHSKLYAQGDGITLAGGKIVIDDAVLVGQDKALTLIAGGQGDIAPVHPSEKLVLTGGKIRISGDVNDLGQRLGSLETTDGGDIKLHSGKIVIDGGQAITLANRAEGGNITVSTNQLSIRKGGEVGTLTMGAFQSGTVNVTAADINLVQGSSIRSQTQGDGDAGSIAITNFDRLLIRRGPDDPRTAIESDVAAGAAGNSGLVLVTGNDLRLIDGGEIFSSTFGDGNARAVRVNVATLIATDGGQISSSAQDNLELDVPATGAGGSVTVNASERIEFSGFRPAEPHFIEPDRSGIFSLSGGNVSVRAPSIIMRNGADIRAVSFFAAPTGDVTLQGSSLILSTDAEVSTISRGSGPAGNIILSFGKAVDLRPQSFVGSLALQEGNGAGRIDIITGRLIVGQGSKVSSNSLASEGGAITINTSDFAVIDGGNLTTTSLQGGAASIDYSGGPLVLRNNGLLETRGAFGDAGEVSISSSIIFVEVPGAALDVSADIMIGTVALTPIEEGEFLDSNLLSSDFCIAAVTGGSSLRLVPLEAHAGPNTVPALFGSSIPYPVSSGKTSSPALVLQLDEEDFCYEQNRP